MTRTLVAVLVHLDPRPVELRLDRRGRRSARAPRPRSSAVCASIGITGHRRSRPNRASPAAPSASAAAATTPRSPASMYARRTSAGDAGGARDRVDDDALERALAELADDERAEEALLASVAREKSSARATTRPRDPRARAPIARAPRRPRSSSDGPSAGGGRSRRAAQPTRIGPYGRVPNRYATTIGASSGRATRRQAARAAILAERADVSETLDGRPGDLVEEHRRRCRASATVGQAGVPVSLRTTQRSASTPTTMSTRKTRTEMEPTLEERDERRDEHDEPENGDIGPERACGDGAT